MEYVESTEALEALYGKPPEAALVKVARRMTPCYRQWIMASRLCILGTVGPEGTDGSPRGDDGPVVMELDPGTLALPDWRGNNRIDSLRNIVRDPRVSLMFLVPGSDNVVRVNGTAKITADDDLRARFEKKGRLPICVMVIRIEEIYAQCARALLRARTWKSGDESDRLPTVGEMLSEMTQGSFDGKAYDEAWPERAQQSLW
ncbi:pyridoxamine 5'-phosphate oxidase family protein [Pseudodonghicola flavimaris]|uniref:Pyridoxamine 5'-phosphate oxidase family protein n=1 Tax=Pseudodonghicola flavimaris TaxID=3050036 RepID=A0ABT7EX73_9RHOB|nr:pyridoxamine 5'-phosphate oxidase family protein [Pseudodonghicola flavimaris]MDK3016948.1 pyridoxamine 5'-phosphate oxidase family protein [Pseudodonghicola flavimaris]